MSIINFIKMHGCGNDFVIIDQMNDNQVFFSLEMIQKIANRRYGIGCDQVILLKHSQIADCFMQIYNADGSEAGACGNATRCVAKLIANNNHKKNVVIQTLAGLLCAHLNDNELITVDMGIPSFKNKDLYLSNAVNPLLIPIKFNELLEGAVINVGNVHLICFCDKDINDIELEKLSAFIKNMNILLEEVNISIVNISNDKILIRTREKGVGETLCCGTAACAAALLAMKKKYLEHNPITVCASGGELYIKWQDNNHIFMTGNALFSFNGQFKI